MNQQTIQQVHIDDLSPKAFRKAYVKALFLEDKRWTVGIEKYQMIIPGSLKNARDRAKDVAEKERLQEQVSAETYKDRKAFYEAWRNAPCCADDCDLYCDQCPNDEIIFESVPAHGLDADVRRFITNYVRYQTATELKAEKREKINVANQKHRPARVFSGVRDGKSDYGAVWIGGQKRGGLPGQPEGVASDQAERIEAMLSHPIGEEVVAWTPD